MELADSLLWVNNSVLFAEIVSSSFRKAIAVVIQRGSDKGAKLLALEVVASCLFVNTDAGTFS